MTCRPRNEADPLVNPIPPASQGRYATPLVLWLTKRSRSERIDVASLRAFTSLGVNFVNTFVLTFSGPRLRREAASPGAEAHLRGSLCSTLANLPASC